MLPLALLQLYFSAVFLSFHLCLPFNSVVQLDIRSMYFLVLQLLLKFTGFKCIVRILDILYSEKKKINKLRFTLKY